MSDLYLKFRYFVLLITTALFVGCSESTLESNAFKALRPVIKDPSSYELISIEAVDSLTEYDNINNAIRQHEEMQEVTLSLIKDAISSAEGKKDMSDNLKQIEQYFIDVKTDSALISFLDRKLVVASKMRICAIKYVYRFRYLNDAGLKSPGMYYFWAKPDGTVIQLVEKEEKLDPAPISIPGYEELLNEAIDMAILKKDSIEASVE